MKTNFITSKSCYKCEYLGEYRDKNGNPSLYSAFVDKENHLSIMRNKNRYSVTVTTRANKKRVIISCGSQTSLEFFWSILMDILRFENLFDGCFFPVVNFLADDIEYTDQIKGDMLSYCESNLHFFSLPIFYPDKEYRKLFYAWLRYEKKVDIIHPVFLYSTYTNVMTVDLRLAMLLEVFESLAEIEHSKNSLVLKCNPTITHTAKCPTCGTIVTKTSRNKQLYFSDILEAIVNKYGKTIFKGESRKRIINKAVSSRNTIDHVIIGKAQRRKNFREGQYGLYLLKFSLLYISIVLNEIGVDAVILNKYIEKYTSSLNCRFSEYRITS